MLDDFWKLIVTASVDTRIKQVSVFMVLFPSVRFSARWTGEKWLIVSFLV